ncbi:ClpXP protease specificity-enhancing factor SspB [Vibrio coralliirubri]|uniref:stringent starvation protein B n=1 Tax=Vibrio coralliirubri TaxID=1516159 RepID=UPI00228504C2|nr:ClpXP protease specificity-enhancing factor SspB [Vibrio coralliirubri]MCY9861395.1 ClpXP protease specificity-enhancing factor SspB [Vibrio coralliirubri]
MTTVSKHSSMAPYLFRAYYDWMTDNELTQFIYVNASIEGVAVPLNHVDKDGGITLNIGSTAIGGLSLGEDCITFNSRFQGKIHELVVPYIAIKAMWDRNGEVYFAMEDELTLPTSDDLQDESVLQDNHKQVIEQQPDEPEKSDEEKPARAKLQVVK